MILLIIIFVNPREKKSTKLVIYILSCKLYFAFYISNETEFIKFFLSGFLNNFYIFIIIFFELEIFILYNTFLKYVSSNICLNTFDFEDLKKTWVIVLYIKALILLPLMVFLFRVSIICGFMIFFIV